MTNGGEADRQISEVIARSGPSRDETHYYEDGSCIFLVEDTLFNVHRSMLSRDGSTFNTLFALPQGDNEEGKSDDKPIVLPGDTATEFRHFLDALYALPPELQTFTSPSANLSGLISITRISNKYSFKSLEAWALGAIQDYVNRKPSPIHSAIPSPSVYVYSRDQSTFPTKKSTEPLTSLIFLAQLCGHAPLLNTMINFLRELMSNSLHYAYLAMTLSDELDIKSLRGAAYLEVMQKAVIISPVEIPLGLEHTFTSALGRSSHSYNQDPTHGSNPLLLVAMANALAPLAPIGAGSAGGGTISTGSGTNNLFPLATAPSVVVTTTASNSSSSSSASAAAAQRPPGQVKLPITPPQRLRLLSGYYRLSLTWDQLRLTPPEFEHAPSCASTWHQHGCTQAWTEFWKERTKSDAVLSLGTADVLGRLRVVQKEYERWGSAAYMHNDCRACARRRMGELYKKVEESLGDYFEDQGVSVE